VGEIIKHWQGQVEYVKNSHAVHEANLLNLAIDKSRHYLGWCPVWNFNRSIEETVVWYLRDKQKGQHSATAVVAQIESYTADASAMNLVWSR
jgi:CDP-glucose 4,6-dehydratase